MHELRPWLHRLPRVDDRRQDVVFDDDGVSGVARDVAIGRDDDSHRLAAVVDLIHGDRAMIRRGSRGAAVGYRVEQLGNLRSGVHGFDTVHGRGGAGVDAADACVRHVAALVRDVQHPGNLDVVDVGATSLNQAWIFASLDALSYELRQYGRRRPSITSCWRRTE